MKNTEKKKAPDAQRCVDAESGDGSVLARAALHLGMGLPAGTGLAAALPGTRLGGALRLGLALGRGPLLRRGLALGCGSLLRRGLALRCGSLLWRGLTLRRGSL
jgi:hypothetical protein